MNSYYLAVDLGGTQIRAARYTETLEIDARVSHATRAEQGLEPVMARIRIAVQEIWPDGASTVKAVGLGAPGPFDFRRGIVRFAPNLPGWINVPLRDRLCEMFDVPVFVGNDADVAALAEHRFGAGRGVSDMIYMTISTGIGGGMIFDNRLFTGGNGLGGEVGHIAIDPHGPKCSCGNVGCLEQMASGTAIARTARNRIGAGEPSILSSMVHNDLSRITAKEVNQAARQGDQLSLSVFEDAGTYIGAAIVGLMYLLNPSMFVLGGSVTLAGDMLLDPIKRIVQERAPQVYRDQTQIVLAQLGGDVGLMGALALCLMALQQDA